MIWLPEGVTAAVLARCSEIEAKECKENTAAKERDEAVLRVESNEKSSEKMRAMRTGRNNVVVMEGRKRTRRNNCPP